MFRMTTLSFRSLLLLIIFMVALPAAGIILYSGIQFRNEMLYEARSETLKLTDRIVTEQQNLVFGAEQLMAALAQLPEVKYHDAVRVEPILKELRKLNPMYSNIFIADREGTVWATAVPVKPPFLVSDRRYFRNALTSGQLSSGEYVVSRATTRPVFNLAYPVKDDHGAVIGVISVGFIIDLYRQLLERMGLPAETSFVLIDHQGMVLSRAINPEPYIGKPFLPDEFQKMKDGPEFGTTIRTGIGGDRRIISYRKMRLASEKGPYMYVAAGIPVEVVTRKANRALINSVALLTSFLVLACVGAVLIGKRTIVDRLRLLEDASQRLAAGDLQVRVSDLVAGGELGRLGQTFDAMAMELARRDAERLKAEEDRNRLVSILETTTDVVSMATPEGKIIYFNRAGLELTGIGGQPAEDIPIPQLHPEWAGELIMKEGIPTAIREGVWEGETALLDGNGREVAVSQVILSHRDAQGNLSHISTIIRDISERKRAEEALKESNDKFLSLVANVPGNIAYVNANTLQYELVNDEFEKSFGLPREKIIGSHIKEIIGETNYQHALKYINEVRSGKSVSYENTFDLVSVKRWIQVNYAPIFNDNGQVASIVVLSYDITERKQAEQQMRDVMNYIQTLLRTSPVGITTYKATGEAVSANEAAARIVGTTIDNLEKQNFRNIESWRRFGMLEIADRALATGVEQRGDLHVVSTYGNQVDLDCLFVPFMFGGEQHLMLTVMDISQRKEHEKEQLKIEKLESLGILAGGIAHDFNNILTGIMGNISFAEMFLDATHKSYKPLVEAEKASVRATELAHQLLTFARGGEPIKKVVSLQHLVSESISLMLHGSNVMGTVDIPDSIHAIEADEGQLSQVFHNIIINATQAMPGDGTLAVTAQNKTLGSKNTLLLPPGTYIRLAFTDEGCGISDDDLKKIFDPYFTTKLDGNGLGLASAHSIVSRHGGHIGASSLGGKGTTFTIHLPSIGETYSKYQTDSVTHTAGVHSGGSIMVMDDEKIIRDMTTEMLEYMGYQVTTCENGAEAITQYKAAKESGAPFSTVILDLTIPGGMGGKETAQQILAIDAKACLIVSSGYSNDPIMSDYGSYGFTGAVAKPYRIKELGQLLSSLLNGAAQK